MSFNFSKFLFLTFRKPSIFYAILCALIFTILKFLNDLFFDTYGFRVLNPAIVGIIIGFIIGKHIESGKEYIKLACYDVLTGLNNRYGFTRKSEMIFKMPDHFTEVSNISIDVDDFKQINDQYGHAIGDKVLQEIAKVIQSSVRSTDIATRWGGDEFTVLLPNASYNIALKIADKIKTGVNALTIPVNDALHISINISIGVSSTKKSIVDIDKLLDLSDKKLYESKRNGKNSICGGVL